MFSIIVPIYKVENYLVKCIDSLIEQSYSNVEIILVDDGSPDKCPQICDNYAKKDQRIKVIHKVNGGLSDARNAGLKIATGEYIMFVDSDDYIENYSCEKIVETINKYGNVDIITSNIKYLSHDTTKLEKYTYIHTDNPICGSEFLKTQLINNTMYMSACRNIYRCKFLIDNDLYFKKDIMHEDEQWTPRCFILANNVAQLDIVHYNHIFRVDSITKQNNHVKGAKDLINICKELKIMYAALNDEELKRLLFDYLVMLYLNAFYLGKMLGKEYNSMFDKSFLSGMALTNKNRFKERLFRLNKYIYYYVNRLSKIKFKRYFA
jgi:glycosyltransferase involved in cell wall biosynthesis